METVTCEMWDYVLTELPSGAEPYETNYNTSEKHWAAKINGIEFGGQLSREFLNKLKGTNTRYLTNILSVNDVLEIGNKKLKHDKIVATDNHYYIVIRISREEIELAEYKTAIQVLKAQEAYRNEINPDLVLMQQLEQFTTEQLRKEIERRESVPTSQAQ